LAVRAEVTFQDNETEDVDLGWFTINDSFKVEYRDETSWALLPKEMKQASVDKGWNTCSPGELIGILWSTGVLQ